jgi:type I restriction enzyme, S subunit
MTNSAFINCRFLPDHLNQGLLAKAFRGEPVPQNPNDQPAEKLLERIRAERASNSAKERGCTGRRARA